MNLKEYQQKVLNKLNDYLTHLADFKAKYNKALEFDAEIARDYNFPQKAWEKTTGQWQYHSKQNGLNEALPDIYLKVPTGGGKTLLACHAIDSINKTYLNRQNGLVLWIVPSNQIYRQTVLALKDRAHPYRQILDISSGGRTLIREKTDIFTKQDTDESLVILLLMLPSANRVNKETLKVFRDSGGYTDFFPAEDNYAAQKDLLHKLPNLDVFKTDTGVFDTQIKTSLGNALRLLKPLIIMDEGHRAYGENARNTLNGFNPSFVLELSATPPPTSNKLVEITGRELNDEEMIKLDIHLVNKATDDWRDTMLASMAKRDELEKLALIYQSNTNEYIRPISLIQVERTGTDPNDKNFIHAEHIKAFLISKGNVPAEQIAIKSSQTDDIEGIDLLSKECAIRYIITKQALQEGWDCSFASILTILTNPGSATGITQLVGRILRQPYGRKTQIKQLDECYVFTYRQNAQVLVKEIKSGLEEEGLGDITGRIVSDGAGADLQDLQKGISSYRPGFKKFEGKIYLPKFVIQEKDSYRNINFEADILQRINWDELSVASIADRTLSKQSQGEQELNINLAGENNFIARNVSVDHEANHEINEAFIAHQLNEIVPNPWIGFDKVKEAVAVLSKSYSFSQIATNTVFIIEELKTILSKERDRLAEIVFKDLIDKNKLFFFLIAEEGFHLLPSHIEVNKTSKLIRNNHDPIQNSLFDYIPEADYNEGLEKPVAIYLDEQEKLLWWYRNVSKQHYHIQGWKKNKIYPDFIAAKKSAIDTSDYSTVYVLETKGLQLAGNQDTNYKKNVLDLCNELATKRKWEDVFDDFPNHNFSFQMVYGDEWQNKINQLFSN